MFAVTTYPRASRLLQAVDYPRGFRRRCCGCATGWRRPAAPPNQVQYALRKMTLPKCIGEFWRPESAIWCSPCGIISRCSS